MGDTTKKITLNQFKYLLDLDQEFIINVYQGKSFSGEDNRIEFFHWCRKIDTPITIEKMNKFFNKYGHKEIDNMINRANQLHLNIMLEDKEYK